MGMTRAEAIMDAVSAAQEDMLPGDEANVIACTGDQRCPFGGVEVQPDQQNGCHACQRIRVGEELARA